MRALTLAVVLALAAPALAQAPPPVEMSPPPVEQWAPYPPTPYSLPPCPPPSCVVVPPPCPPPRPRRKVLFKVSLAYDARYALGETLNAAASELQIGGEKNGFGGAARLQVQAGRTERGLRFEWIEFGPAFEWTVSPRWRLGFGFTNGWLQFHRVALAPGPAMTSVTWGSYLETTVDLLKAAESSSALYASARVGWDHIFDVTDLPSESVQGSIGLGYRY
jgi:hypothetical protein